MTNHPDNTNPDDTSQPRPPGEETDTAWETRQVREFNDGMRAIDTFSPEAVAKAREEQHAEDEALRRRLFGDREPTIWTDRYTDL